MGNINTIPVVPTESAAYQDAANSTELEQLVEALPFCETADDLALVMEDYAIEVVEDAIAMQDTQPRRLLLTKWLANAISTDISVRTFNLTLKGTGNRQQATEKCSNSS
jgi:hypothetical protein